MQGFLPAVIAVSIFAKLIKFSLPKDSSITKYSSMLLGLCVTAIMIVPIVNAIDAISDISFSANEIESIEKDYSEIFEEHIAESLYPSVEEYIRKVLEERFSVPRENAEVFIRFSADGDVISLEQILIFLKAKSVFADTGAISHYFEEQFLCPVDVSVDIP